MNDFSSTMQALLEGMDHHISSKTVVGDVIHLNDTIIVPMIDVSFGVGAGAFAQKEKQNSGGGLGGRMTPSALLVIKDGQVKLVNIKQQDGLTKILDMVPDLVNKFTDRGPKDSKHPGDVTVDLAEEGNISGVKIEK